MALLLTACQQPGTKQNATAAPAGQPASAGSETGSAAQTGTPVETANVRLGDLQASSSATALLEGCRDISVAAEIGGTISRLYVDDGSRVKQGQLLAELDHTQLDANVASTQAQLDGARAQLAIAKSATRPQQLAQAEAALSQAQAGLDLAQKNYDRQQELFKAGVISKAAIDAAETQLKQAQSGYDAAAQAVSLAKEGARVEDVQAAQAAVHGLEAALTIAKDTQRKAYMKAPFAGQVTKVIPEEHEMVAAGTVVMGIVDDSQMELTVGVNGEVIPKLALGQPVEIAIEALATTVKGKVKAIGVKGDSVSGTFPVKLALDNAGGKLLSGMVGTVTLPTAAKRNVIVVPREVVLFMKDGTYVMLAVTEGGKTLARSRKVEVGLDAGQYLEIKSGISAGDELIVTGMKNVFDGDSINVTAKRELELPQIAAAQ
jgi:HlyD family secretion protein